tara:strand:+ start:2854 stop:3393 length:540 start_codon:yes stop_codon:yes gene_type:complete
MLAYVLIMLLDSSKSNYFIPVTINETEITRHHEVAVYNNSMNITPTLNSDFLTAAWLSTHERTSHLDGERIVITERNLSVIDVTPSMCLLDTGGHLSHVATSTGNPATTVENAIANVWTAAVNQEGQLTSDRAPLEYMYDDVLHIETSLALIVGAYSIKIEIDENEDYVATMRYIVARD